MNDLMDRLVNIFILVVAIPLICFALFFYALLGIWSIKESNATLFIISLMATASLGLGTILVLHAMDFWERIHAML